MNLRNLVVALGLIATASVAQAGPSCRNEAAQLAKTQVQSILDDPTCAAARVIEDDLQNLPEAPGFFVRVECPHAGFGKWLRVSTSYVELGYCQAGTAAVVDGDPEAAQLARRKEVARRIELGSKPYTLDCKSRFGSTVRMVELNVRPGLSLIDGNPAHSAVSASLSDYSWGLGVASSSQYGMQSFSIRSPDLKTGTASEHGRNDCSGQNEPGHHPTCTETYDDDFVCRFH